MLDFYAWALWLGFQTSDSSSILVLNSLTAEVFLSLFFLSAYLLEDEKAKREVSSWTVEGDINTDPWAGYRYTGKLRPHYPLVSK